jgi:hypothetical protein
MKSPWRSLQAFNQKGKEDVSSKSSVYFLREREREREISPIEIGWLIMVLYIIMYDVRGE